MSIPGCPDGNPAPIGGAGHPEADSAGLEVCGNPARSARHAGRPDPAELGERIGLARSTVHRILNAMRNEGLVERSARAAATGSGPALHRMADAVLRNDPGGLHPLLEELARSIDETADLSVLDRGRATIADQITSSQRLRAVSMIGESVPLHCTANGKAFLAAMDEAGLARALPGTLARLTPATVTDRAVLEAELVLIRARGYALDREEHTEGICGAGVFLGFVADVPMAVSIPMPAQRFYGREHAIAEALPDWAAGARARSAAR